MKKLFLLLLLVFCGIALNAQAAPLVLPTNEPVYFQFNNLEQVDTRLNATGSGFLNGIDVPDSTSGVVYGTAGNWGVFNISSIQHGGIATLHQDISGGTAFFADGFSSGQVHGIFYDINLIDGTHATGGIMDIYWTDMAGPGANPYGAITAADLNGGIAPTTAAVDKFTAGVFLARLRFDTGIVALSTDPLANITTIKSDSDITNITVSGQADSFASVDTGVIGLWTAALNGDWFWVDTNFNGTPGEAGETRDIRFSNFYNSLASWNGVQGVNGLRSNDPGRVYTASAIPEPSTMLLMGIGILGIAVNIRRKMNR